MLLFSFSFFYTLGDLQGLLKIEGGPFSSGLEQFLGSYVVNRVLTIRSIRWLAWVFQNKERKKEINLIDTYVTVPIDVRITMLIRLSSFSICIWITLVPAYEYLNMYRHFPPPPYSYTFIAIFIRMVYILFYIYKRLFVYFCFFLYNFKRHLCHGAYWCTHNHAHMPILFFHLHLHFSNSCLWVSKHVHAFPSSPIFIHIYRHIHMYGLCSVLYL